MSVDLSQFDRAVRQFVEHDIPAAVLQKTTEVAVRVLEGVVHMTPVASGLARGGWQVSTVSPATTASERLDPDGTATIEAGMKVIMDAKPFEVIHIVNNVAYIRELEAGNSTQAPAGMVAVTLSQLNVGAIG